MKFHDECMRDAKMILEGVVYTDSPREWRINDQSLETLVKHLVGVGKKKGREERITNSQHND